MKPNSSTVVVRSVDLTHGSLLLMKGASTTSDLSTAISSQLKSMTIKLKLCGIWTDATVGGVWNETSMAVWTTSRVNMWENTWSNLEVQMAKGPSVTAPFHFTHENEVVGPTTITHDLYNQLVVVPPTPREKKRQHGRREKTASKKGKMEKDYAGRKPAHRERAFLVRAQKRRFGRN